MEEEYRKDECRIDMVTSQDYRSRIHPLVDRIVSQYDKDGRFHHIGPEPIPSRQAIIDIIYRTIPILFPGFFSTQRIDDFNAEYYLGQQVTELFEALVIQIQHAIRHDCIRFSKACVHCEERSHEIGLQFIEAIPDLQK